MEHPLSHYIISVTFACIAALFGMMILIKRLHRRFEYQSCLALLFLYCLWQISELAGGVWEHAVADFFKLAPMVMIVLFGMKQNETDQKQTADIERLEKELEEMERNLALKKTSQAQ